MDRSQPHRRNRYNLLLGVFVLLMLAGCAPRLYISGSQDRLYPLSADQERDQKIVDFYRPYKLQVDSLMKQVIAVSAVEIARDRPEGLLNNFFADAMSHVGKQNNIDFDMAYTNYGGLRIPLPKGDVILSTVFELMPFENLLTTVQFNGTQMQEFFNYIAAVGGDPISGARFRIQDKKAVDIKVNGSPLVETKTYTILTSDYMANGGDGGDIFLQSTGRKEYDIKLRDALIMYIREHTAAGKPLNPVKDGRISIK